MPYLLIVLGSIARLIPHPWNFTPIGAVGLFVGANCRPQTAWTVPIAALLISDAFLGFYHPVMMGAVYLGFVLSPLIGRATLRRRRSLPRFGVAVFSAATVFYLISNFGVWLVGYPHTIDGLVECYVRAIPYYGSSLLGNSIYTAILFGVHELVTRHLKGARRAIEG